MAWADAYFDAHGKWPVGKSSDTYTSEGDSWHSIDTALKEVVTGCRAAVPSAEASGATSQRATVAWTHVIGATDRGLGPRLLRRPRKVAIQNVPNVPPSEMDDSWEAIDAAHETWLSRAAGRQFLGLG